MADESWIRQNSLLISLLAGNSDAETGSYWTASSAMQSYLCRPCADRNTALTPSTDFELVEPYLSRADRYFPFARHI